MLYRLFFCFYVTIDIERRKEVKRLKNRYVVMLILMFCFTLSMSKVKAIDYSELDLAPGEEVVAETTKYYKTVTVISRSDLMIKANLGEISSITTEVTKEEYIYCGKQNTILFAVISDLISPAKGYILSNKYL